MIPLGSAVTYFNKYSHFNYWMELVPQREILKIFFFFSIMAVLISYLIVRSFFNLTFSIAHLSFYPPAINQQNLI
jgi:hypothetical protein